MSRVDAISFSGRDKHSRFCCLCFEQIHTVARKLSRYQGVPASLQSSIHIFAEYTPVRDVVGNVS